MVRWVLLAILISVAFGLFLWNRARIQRDPTVVIDGDPIVVASLNNETNTVVLVSIPAALSVDVALGLGTYPISSLWQLGEHEGVGGDIMRESIGELLAINISWHVGRTNEGSQVFRLGNIGRLLSGELKTNISPLTFLWLSWRLGSLTPQHLRSVSIPESLATAEMLPDGSTRKILSKAALDTLISDEFENPDVRAEKLTISVMNTSQTPLLAQQIARKISRIGGNVVRTGNEEATIDSCQIRGSSEVLKTKTVALLKRLLGCLEKESESQEYSDVTVFTR